MSSLQLHFLNARGAFAGLRDWIQICLTETHHKAIQLMPLQSLDVVISTGKRVINEKGHLGYAPGPGTVFVTVDPDSPALRVNADASLERMFAHELHHAARWDGPGYGASLGEALVSEGLAGHFAREVCGDVPEPWEQLPEDEVLRHAGRAKQEWNQTNYNHGEWFFGSGDLPRWLGYSMGSRIIERFLAQYPNQTASRLVDADVGEFRASLEML